MKKDLIDYVIKYGSARSLWLYAQSTDENKRTIKRLEKLTDAYFNKILEIYHERR